MNHSFILRALAVWLLIVLAEVVNGTLRQVLIAPLIGDHTARQISTLSGCALILLITWATSAWLGATTRRTQWAVGALWVVLMLAFEIGFGRFVVGASWQQLSADYNLREGGLLGLGMLWLLCAPRMAATLKAQWR